MNKLMMVGLVSATMLMACGGAKEEKETEAPTFCDCLKDGPPPPGCDKVMSGITEEEYATKKAECE